MKNIIVVTVTSARDQVVKHEIEDKDESKDETEPPASSRRQWGAPRGTVVKQLHAVKLNESGQSDISDTSVEESKGQFE